MRWKLAILGMYVVVIRRPLCVDRNTIIFYLVPGGQPVQNKSLDK